MKTCQNCGNLITEKSRFCPRCGALLQDDALYEPLETLHCHPLTVTGPQPESTAQTVEAGPKKDPRHDLWNSKIWILCGAGLLIVILACAFIGV